MIEELGCQMCRQLITTNFVLVICYGCWFIPNILLEHSPKFKWKQENIALGLGMASDPKRSLVPCIMYLRSAHSMLAYYLGQPPDISLHWKWQHPRPWFLGCKIHLNPSLESKRDDHLGGFTLRLSLLHQLISCRTPSFMMSGSSTRNSPWTNRTMLSA